MKRYILLLTMAVFTIIVISSCTCMNDLRPESRDKRVLIITRYLDDDEKPKVEPEVVRLKYKKGQQVIWTIDDPERKFTIKFDKIGGSPFDGDEFNNAKNKSGKVKVDPDQNVVFYYYSVKVKGFKPIDPEIIIER